MSNLQAKAVTNDNLLHEVALLQQQGYRLVTLTCLDTGNGHEILYHFDKRYELANLRMLLPAGETLCSISCIYAAAMIVENEVKDHFGIQLAGLALDFQGRMILTDDAPKAPMNKRCGMEIDARIAGAAPKTATPPTPVPPPAAKEGGAA